MIKIIRPKPKKGLGCPTNICEVQCSDHQSSMSYCWRFWGTFNAEHQQPCHISLPSTAIQGRLSPHRPHQWAPPVSRPRFLGLGSLPAADERNTPSVTQGCLETTPVLCTPLLFSYTWCMSKRLLKRPCPLTISLTSQGLRHSGA